ncbi:gamma-glutamylcyclotransferase family protein [Croceitalea rosinachiae]|uniref:Gamma-glutamylcyclotransferase family protein n=1 Tax=Croceitalea rosinachiae TaxID=3075596 RepID=A0ABU3A6Q4_9FLAO|nr:gamma-glutamylcyclotransferase family protein [Croceitalea sp. F388]MDT0605857.1 gamma-glutamylcyclotransferase family protein [Croceitalea sp. F388]
MRTTQFLFSYGSLQEEKVQLSVLERKLKGKFDTLIGYKKFEKKLMNKYPIIEKTNNSKDKVKGILYQVSNLDIYKIDLYESLAYSRTSVTLKSGTKAWVYIPSFN